jgi:Mg-chelatase subunit ChlD
MSISFFYPIYLWLLLLIPLTAALALVGRTKSGQPRFWVGLGLRSLLLLAIIFALAGFQIRLPSQTLSVVFVVDASDSIPPQERDSVEAQIRQAIKEMPSGDRAAVILFGQDALVERLASQEKQLAEFTSVPITTRTNIASALQLAMALFPNEGAKRIVLVSDGRENLNQALKQAEVAALQEIQLVYQAVGKADPRGEVLLDSIKSPTEIRFGQGFDLEISINASQATRGELRIFSDGELITTREVSLGNGSSHFSIPIEKPAVGFHRYRAQIVPDTDTLLQNNEASSFTTVSGPPAILIVEGEKGESANLISALQAAQMSVTSTAPESMPSTLPELARYDAIILSNVTAARLPGGVMAALPNYVREMGRGLLVTGGENAFGAGGYLRTALEDVLPVTMEVQSKDRSANLALVLAVDSSGSMGRCHCDNPDLTQKYTPRESGQPKVDIAKEAIMRSAEALGSQDQLGVVAFNSRAAWARQLTPISSGSDLEQSISAIRADGQTNLLSGLEAAYASLKDVDAARKHVILLTDGWTTRGDIFSLVDKMHADGITVSIVAAGNGSAEYLNALAEKGGGRYYPARDMLNVPNIFLKETVQSVGQYIIEEPFYPLPSAPSPILRGLDEKLLPALYGYNGATAKNTARLDLLTPRGDPLLATWMTGLGKSAVWTSDLKGRWGTDWVKWERFSRFAVQMVNAILPTPANDLLSVQSKIMDKGVLLQLEAHDKQGLSLNNLTVNAHLVGPNLKPQTIELKQAGAGRYETLARLDQPGAYLITYSASQDIQPLGQVSSGLVIPYSPEYRAAGENIGVLDALAQTTGGGRLNDPAQIFLHNLPFAESARELWYPLLFAAALLFPIEVAVRRLVFTRRDWAELRSRLRQYKLQQTAPASPTPQVLPNLFAARDRSRSRTPQRVLSEEPEPGQPAETSNAPEPPPAQPPPPTEANTLERLKAAKKRSQKS